MSLQSAATSVLGVMRRAGAGIGAMVALAVLAAPAEADPTDPFAFASAHCAADADEATSPSAFTRSAAVDARHFLPIVRVTGDAQRTPFGPQPNPYGRGGANLENQGTEGTYPRAVGDIGTDAFYSASPTVFWQTTNTFEVGQTAYVGSDCADGDHEWTTRAQFYDRPTPPVSFTGSRNHDQSRLGFMAAKRGRYVAEVTRLDLAGLRVARESYNTFEGEWVEDGEWRSGTFERPGKLDLGTLSAGPHTLTVEATQPDAAATDPDRLWTVVIRYIPANAPQPKPKPTDPPVVTPAPGTPPAPPATPQNPAPRPGDPPPATGAPGPAVPPPTAQGVARRDAVRPKVRLTVARHGRYRRVRVRCVNERCVLRVTVRYGKHKRVLRRNLARRTTVSLRVRTAGTRMRITITARDRAGNRTVLHRSR